MDGWINDENINIGVKTFGQCQSSPQVTLNEPQVCLCSVLPNLLRSGTK